MARSSLSALALIACAGVFDAGAQTVAPDQTETLYRNAVTDARAGRHEEALRVLRDLSERFPLRQDILADYALVQFWAGKNFEALAAYQAVLAKDPGNRDARRGQILTLSRIGAPQLALELADRSPGLLSAEERLAIAADRTAHRVRWGALAADSGRGPGRFAAIDFALADSDAAAAKALDRGIELSAIERQLVLDRLIALRDRFRMRDTVALYEALAARPAPLPGYAKSAAASAYLYLEQPEKSRDLYREVLALDPANAQNRIGLFYALAESEDHRGALIEVERAVADTPQWIGAWSPVTTHENPDYPGVLSARAMAPLFANRPAEAWGRLRALSARAPYNTNLRTDYASSMRARGWPRRAEEELRWVLAVDPENSGALGERAGALLEMRDYRSAETALNAARDVAEENGRVKRAARLWQVHQMRELIVDATFGRSSGGPSGTRDYAIDSRLYSRPLHYNYRAFLHSYNAEAKFAAGTGSRDRLGAGLEYRSTRYIASGELSHDLHGNRTGVAGALAYTPNDTWTLRGDFDSNANETPLQASLAGITARRASAEAAWQANESRGAAVSFAHMDFSDDNRRDIVQTRWTERVIKGPVYKLEITAALYASRNSLAGTPYFNPSRDFSPTLEFANEWIQWRRYTRAFRHRVVVTVGNYWQQGFGTGPVAGARYEQEWTADDRLTLRYGIGRSKHPYDGIDTTRDYGYLTVNWRF
ncbi:MAG: poly-beta-1,6 N-acetyl-D-glucosamine export porin PgaA [Candidatus Parcubacteria bacterium]|nr:poly-beta-1,6 N-acetyl-D-glucosamine export porin PgaA [Burkholderiales bacterium]